MAYNNDNLAVAIHDTDNIITEENIEECVVDYWKQRVKDFWYDFGTLGLHRNRDR